MSWKQGRELETGTQLYSASHRFADWITAMAINVEEHTITQSVLALEQPAAWKALESFARVRLLARRPRHLGPDPPDRDRPGSDLARLPCLGRR